MTPEPEQYPLPLPQDWPALDRAAFLVGTGNAEALAWIDRWPDWPAPAVVLQGPEGSGKSHLAGLWRARAQAGSIEGAALGPAAVPGLIDADQPLLVETADAAPELPLLHLYNGLVERGRTLLLTARLPPARWGIALPDLRSRLSALPVAELRPPGDDLVRAVLAKRFADRQLAVADDVVDYLAKRIERSFAAINRIVAALDAASLAAHRKIALPLAQRVLKDLQPGTEEPNG
jgi:chromosomal replication initiation ATPase DnaA